MKRCGKISTFPQSIFLILQGAQFYFWNVRKSFFGLSEVIHFEIEILCGIYDCTIHLITVVNKTQNGRKIRG